MCLGDSLKNQQQTETGKASNKKIRSQWSMKNVMDTPYFQQQPDWKFTNKHGGIS